MMKLFQKTSRSGNWSLRKRLSIASAAIILLAFYIIYQVTKTAYISATQISIKQSLSGQIYALMAVAEDLGSQLQLPIYLRNDRMNQLDSGLVAYVLDIDGDLIWRSASSEHYNVLPDISQNYSLQQLSESKLAEQTMLWIGDKIIWEHENGMEGEYLFLVGEKKSIMQAQIRAYKKVIAGWLWVATILLILVLVCLLNISLRPLKQAQQQIEQIGEGNREKIGGNFPTELLPLTNSINSLLQRESLQKQRYRDALGNLAHSLKTPLAVLTSEIQASSEEPDRELLSKQLGRINDIVKYQLNRSVVTASQALQRKTLIKPEVEKIVDALNKVHAERKLQISANIQSDSWFPGDQGDLMELVGNLADNACKWATNQISIEIFSDDQFLSIKVADDGKGIPAEKRSLILDRGKRLDQKAEGQGLGLSIVMDIISIYQGELAIEQSELGGALFESRLPLI